MAENKQDWNLKYQIQDPIILHVYEFNIVNVLRDPGIPYDTLLSIANSPFLFPAQLTMPPY